MASSSNTPANGGANPDTEEPSQRSIPVKRPRTNSGGHNVHNLGTKKPKCPDFLVGNLDDFYKQYPAFRQPSEIGFFSFDSKGDMIMDRSGLRYYSHPSRLGLDLKVGYSEFVPKLNQTPDLTNILTWISNKWECFIPKIKNQKSVDMDNTAGGLSINLPPAFNDFTSSKSQSRPDNLLTDFVCWRGLLTKLLCTPYNKSEPWKLVAQFHNGTIYMRELETVEKKNREDNMSPREKQMCYWGLKFEDYMTRRDHPTLSTGTSSTSSGGTVNPLESFCSVVRTRLNKHSIVMAGEVDCCEHNSKERPPQNYIELKTSRFIYTDRNKLSFKKNKLMKWWAQSYLIGVPKIVCGFRDDNGSVNSLQTFRTIDIPRECHNDPSLWQASICLNFLDELLTWIKSTVTDDNKSVSYIIEWNSPYTHVTASHQTDPDMAVLPEWYLNKQDMGNTASAATTDPPPILTPSSVQLSPSLIKKDTSNSV